MSAELLQSYTNIIAIFLSKVLIFILIISIETHCPIIFLLHNFLANISAGIYINRICDDEEYAH